jgi:hypothetical protein
LAGKGEKFLQYLFHLRFYCLSLAGELLRFLLPLPVPGTSTECSCFVLALHRDPSAQARRTAVDFLIGILPILFTPTIVGLTACLVFFPTISAGAFHLYRGDRGHGFWYRAYRPGASEPKRSAEGRPGAMIDVLSAIAYLDLRLTF